MSDIEKTKQTAIEKYSDIAKNLEFCDDFGNTPVFMAHFTRDRSLIGVLSLLGGFIAMAGLGIPGALFVAFAAFNDLSYTGKDGNEKRMGEDANYEVEEEAIEVKSETIPDSQNVLAAAKPSYGVSKVLSPLDILIRARFSHRAFYGGQRTGKSYLAAIASQALSLTGIKVFHMNLFSHGPEDRRYWVHAARSVQCDLSSLSPDEALPFIRQAQTILSEFKVTSDALLIIDEITSMGNLRSEHLENLQPFINGLVSYINAIRDSSKKRHKAVWTIAPGIVATGLDQGVKELIKGLAPVLVSIPKDVSIMWEDQTLTTDMTVYGQLKINYQGISEPPSMDCDRMVLLDNIWMSMGELPSLQTINVKSEPTQNLEAVPETSKLSQGQVTWERLKVGSPAYPNARDPIDIGADEVEPWVSDESIEVTPKPSYDEWKEYPVHQAILIYMQGKIDKTDRNVYDSIKKKIDSTQWESIPGTDNMSKLKNVLSYLTNTRKVAKISDNSYSAIN